MLKGIYFRKLLFIFIFILSLSSWGQIQVYQEDFTGQNDKGQIGGTTDVSGVNWNIDVANGDFSDMNDFFAVQNEVFEAQDVDGTVTWSSQSFSIANFTSLSFSFDAKADGDFEAGTDIFKVDIIVDGAMENLYTGTVDGDPFYFDNIELMPALQNFSKNIISTGNNAKIVISVNINPGTELVGFDNLVVEGQFSGNLAPQITNIAQNPLANNVTDSDVVNISSEITDSDGIASASLNWGATSGNLTNSIPLNTTSGDSYETASNIPTQSNGTTVYYEITATDANASPETTTSNEQQYTVAEPTNILAIQDFDGTTPEWTYSKDVAFFDNGFGSNGYYGIIDIINASPLDNSNFDSNILAENDLNDEGNNGTTGFATITFDPINISAATNVTFTFDYQIKGYNANNDDAKYEVFFDGTGQGEVFLLDGNGNIEEAMGSVNVSVPNSVNNVSLEVSIRNDGNDGYSGFDNFKLEGTGAAGNNPPPINNVMQNPLAENVTSSDSVSVSADVSDPDGVASVELNWGASSGNLTNTIAMNLASGTTYTTTSDIPAQANGTKVFYQITATDANANPQSSTISDRSYLVDDPLPTGVILITEIMQDPSTVPDEFGEYFEVYNRTDQDVDMNGWTFEGNASESNTIDSTLIVPSHGFAVIGKNADVIINGGIKVDFSFAGLSFNLANSGDEIILFDAQNNEIDRVEYDGGNVWPNPNGASMYFTGNPMENNNDGTMWNISTNSLGINGDKGSPKFSGEAALPETFLFTSFYSGNPEWLPSDPSGMNSTENIIRVDSSETELTANTSVYNITVSDSATLKNQNVIRVSNYIKNKGNFTFLSDANQTGEMGVLPDSARVEGDFEIHRYFSAGRAYRYVSSPVTTTSSINSNWQERVHNTSSNYGNDPNNPNPAANKNPNPGFGTHITGSQTGNNGFDATETGNSSLFTYDNSNPTFNAVTNTDTDTIDAGKPYVMVVRGSRDVNLNFTNSQQISDATVLRTTGKLKIGDTVMSDLNPNDGGFSLVGNPYQSAVNINSLLNNATSLNTGQYYVFDPNLGDFGSYVVVDLTTNGNTSGSEANQYIQSFQAFMIETTGSNPSLTFKETHKAPGNPTATFNNESLTDYAHIFGQLYTTERYNADSTMQVSTGILFDQNFSSEVLNNDAPMPGNFSENFGSVNNGNYLSLERRNLPEAGEVIPLFIDQWAHENYTLVMKTGNLPDDLQAVLKDNYTGQNHELEEGENQITFSINQDANDASTASDRFSITFEPTSLNTKEFDRQSLQLYPNPVKSGEAFVVQTGKYQGKEALVQINALNGSRVYKNQLTLNGKTRINPGNLASGVYIVSLKGKGFSVKKKLIIE
jgi:hypothetical protein